MTWRTYAIAAGVALLALAAAFSAGRFSAPLKVETKTVDRVVYQDRVVEKVVTVEAEAKRVIVYRDKVTKPDGTVREREVEKTATKTDTTKTDEGTATRAGETDHSTATVTTLRPDWRFSVLAGAAYQRPAITIAGPLVLGVEVDRRIIGGVSLGLWFNTYGAAGAALSLEF